MEISKKELEELLWIPCCHLTGMHNPEHFHKRQYICMFQIAKAFERFCKEMGIDPETRSTKECYWCNHPTYGEEEEKGVGLKLSEGRKRGFRLKASKLLRNDKET